MVTISLIMTALTIIALVFGTLFGMVRGRNRSILRLIMIIGCVVVAFLLRGTLMDMIMGIQTSEGTLQETLMAAFNQGENPIPESVQNLIFALIEMIISIISYFVLFFGLRFLTSIILFPILKIFVRKGLTKGVGLGAVFGLIQGIVVAFAVLVPLNGLIITVDKLSQVEIEGNKVVEIPEELGMDTYFASPVGQVYNSIGGWYFEEITKAEMSDGKTLNINDACDMVVAVTGVASSVNGINESVEVLSKADATPQEKVDAVKEVGSKLTEIGQKIEDLSTNATEIINEVLEDVKEMIAPDNEEEIGEINKIFEDLKIEDLNLQSVGQGLTGIATYIEKTEINTEGTEEVTQEDVNNIVHGIAGSSVILDFISGAQEEDSPTFIEVSEDHKELFNNAINEIEEGALTETQIQTLKDLFGIN